jgi:hypothetical protein
MIHWLRFHVSLLANRQVDFMESFGFAVADMMLIKAVCEAPESGV